MLRAVPQNLGTVEPSASETVAGHRVVSLEEWRKEAKAGTAKSGSLLLRRALTVRANPVAGVERALDIVIGTDAQDRYRDVIETAGYELDNYRRNPVVLWCHDYYQLPVGKALAVQIEGSALVARDQFTSQEENPFGFTVYKLLIGGYLSAASVGVDPLEWTYDEELRGYRISRQELLEHSIVPVPANPEALARAKAAGINVKPLDEWARRSLDSIHGGSLAIVPKAQLEAAVKAMGFGSGLKLFELPVETVRAKVRAKRSAEAEALSAEELAAIEAAAQLEAAKEAEAEAESSAEPAVEESPESASQPAVDPGEVAAVELAVAVDAKTLSEMRSILAEMRYCVEKFQAARAAARAVEPPSENGSTAAAPVVVRLLEAESPAPPSLIRIDEDHLRKAIRSAGSELMRPLAEDITAKTGRIFPEL